MKKTIKLLCIVTSLFVCVSLFAQSQVLPFELTAKFDTQDAIILHWKVQEGNYLYRDHISIEPELGSAVRLGHFKLPHAAMKDFQGGFKYAVYGDDFFVKVPIKVIGGAPLSLKVEYQGCSELGFCYAPVHKRLRLSLVNRSVFIDNISAKLSTDLVHDQSGIATLLAEHNLVWIILVFLGLGLLLSLTPCVLPMVPILSSIIIGQGGKLNSRRAFGLSLTYVLTMSVTYALLGLAVAVAGNYLQALWQETWVIVIFSALFVLLALSMFGLYEFRMPVFIEEKVGGVSRRFGGGSYLGVVVMGFLATMILSPCVTAPLVGVLSYIAVTGDKILGVAALFSLGLGMGVPLLAVGMSAGFLVPRAGSWLDSVRIVFGVVLLGLAIFVLQRVLPGSVGLLLWGVLLIIVSVVLGTFKSAVTRIRKGCRAIGLIVFAYAALLLIGGAVGYESPFYPFMQSSEQVQLSFDDVESIDDLQSILDEAKDNNRPVMLYFHATWCIACKEVEAHVFRDARVQRALQSFDILRVDISKRRPAIIPIENLFDVIAPPTIIFIDPAGEVVKGATVVGGLSAERFLARVSALSYK